MGVSATIRRTWPRGLGLLLFNLIISGEACSHDVLVNWETRYPTIILILYELYSNWWYISGHLYKWQWYLGGTFIRKSKKTSDRKSCRSKWKIDWQDFLQVQTMQHIVTVHNASLWPGYALADWHLTATLCDDGKTQPAARRVQRCQQAPTGYQLVAPQWSG